MIYRRRNIDSIACDDSGNESMQTILILAVGSLLLMGLNRFWNGNSHQVHSQVTQAASKPWSIANSGSPASATNQAPTQTDANTSSPQLSNSLPSNSSNLHDIAEAASDALNRFRQSVLSGLSDELVRSTPGKAELLDKAIAELREQLSDGSMQDPKLRNVLEDLLAHSKLERFVTLEDRKQFLQDHLKMQGQLSSVLDSMGRIIGMDEVFAQDRKNEAIGSNPNSTLRERYEAYRETFGIAGDQLTSGVVDAASKGKGGGVLTNLGISQASQAAGEALADAAFKPINRMAYWLWDNGYSPKPPVFPRDFDPKQIKN